uniref:Apple domain-containing protein n=1 Tax=Dracunculus medinensis TaxID=318479 RepID=A0A0N4UGV7_DRAME
MDFNKKRVNYSNKFIIRVHNLLFSAFGKDFCLRNFYKLTNSDFFQRTELRSVEICVERCIDNIEYCRAILFVKENNKDRGSCQLYRVNSLSPNVDIIRNDPFEATSVLIEVLDKCISNETESFLNKIDPELAQKFIDWSKNLNADKPEENTSSFSNIDNWGSELPLEMRSRWHYDPYFEKISKQKYIIQIAKEINLIRNPKKLINVTEKAERIIQPPLNLNAKLGEVERGQLTARSQYIVPPFPEIPTRNVEQRQYLSPNPIQPQISFRGVPLQCRGVNCYAPSAMAMMQFDSRPCATYLGHPCSPAPMVLSNPCGPIINCPSLYQGQAQPQQNLPSVNSYVKPAEQFRPSVSVFRPEISTSSPAWSEWTLSTPCSVTCGRGFIEMRRHCVQPGRCAGESLKKEICERNICEDWSLWSPWSQCSKSCGGGEQKRSRKCYKDGGCDGPSMDVHITAYSRGTQQSMWLIKIDYSIMVQPCNTETCPEWSEWGEWGICSVTCGIGVQKRHRECKGTLQCPGMSTEIEPCEQKPCPVWLTWQSWSECSVTCGGGEKFRTRDCDGDKCEGESKQSIRCNTQLCPEWTSWTQWSECTETCGDGGTKLRTRYFTIIIIRLFSESATTITSKATSVVVQVKIKLYVVYQFAQNGVNGNRGPNAVLPVATDKKLGMIITKAQMSTKRCILQRG